MITDEQLAKAIEDSLDLSWNGEAYEDGKGNEYHQLGRFRAEVRDGTIVLNSGDDFYAVPIDAARLREGLRRAGIDA